MFDKLTRKNQCLNRNIVVAVATRQNEMFVKIFVDMRVEI